MTRDPNKAYIEVGDIQHAGWLTVSIQRSIEQAAAQFSVSLTDTWPGQPNPVHVHPGDPCRVLIGDDVIVTGYVDAVQLAHDAKSHAVSISGRSRTSDIIDCSCVASRSKPKQWGHNRATVLQIARDVCSDYHVDVITDVADLKPLPRGYKAEIGAKAFDVIEQVCREQRLLVTDTRDGKLLLTRVGSQSGPTFAHPGNILSSSLRANVAGRFTEYIVKAQTAGDDDNWGTSAAGVESRVEDLGVISRYRLLVIKGEKQMDKARAKWRANWEAVTRAGRSCQVEITVAGWRDDQGQVYDVNRLCKVVDPVIGVDAMLLSVSVAYSLSIGEGQITRLSLAPPGAYEPELPKKTKAGKGGIGLFPNASAF